MNSVIESNLKYFILAAAKVNCVWANNTYPKEFIHKILSSQDSDCKVFADLFTFPWGRAV